MQLPATVWAQPRAVIAVCAVPGYGKSILLSQWYRKQRAAGWRVILLSAESGDRHGNQLIFQLSAALGWREDQQGESVLDTHGSEGRLALIRALLSELESLEQRTAIFVDDIHEVQHSASSTLALLLRYQPPNVAIVISGRSVPGALLSKPLLEGRLHRVNAEQLALTREEAAALLRQHDIALTPDQIDQLLERTQGWPAAVRLVALSLQQDEASRDRFFRGLGADNPQPLTDYLNDAFLSQQPARTRDLLLRLSVVRQFTGELAQAVTGEADAEATLEDLERQGVPLTRSGGPESRYALHPLVRDFLLQHLKKSDRPALKQAGARAHEWFRRRGMIESAIEVSLDTDALDTAASLINDHAAQTVQQYGRHTAYLRWIDMLPSDALSRFPDIRLKQAWSLDFVKRYDEAERVRVELEQGLPGMARESDARIPDTLEASIELQRCVQIGLRDRAEDAANRTRRWLERWPDASLYDKASAHCVMAFSTKSLSHYDEGLKHAWIARDLALQCQAPYLGAWAQMLAVTSLIKQGRYRQALHESTEQIAALDAQLGERAPAVMMLHALRAGVLYEFDRQSETGSELGSGLTTLVEESSTDPMIVGYITLARLQNAQGARLEALETLAEGEALARTRRLTRLAIALGAERAVLLLRQGELDHAQATWQELQHAILDSSSPEAWDRVLEDKSVRIDARTALLKGKHIEACEMLEPMLRHTRQTGQKVKEMEVQLLVALALFGAGRVREAFATFGDAAGIAVAGGFVRSLLDEGAPMQALIAAYLDDRSGASHASPTTRYLERLRGSAAETAPTQAAPPTAGDRQLVEPLTAREMQILARLQTGLSNRQLADSLFVTEGTMKWHLRNIFAKLGVSSRLQAVARARELGLQDRG